MSQNAAPLSLPALREAFGEALQENAALSGYTTAHVGGPAEALLTVHSADELAGFCQRLWELETPFQILGAGSNVLISDSGLPGVVILNRAKAMRFDTGSETPSVWAESGAMIGTLARQAAIRGLSGFEWAAAVPGTLGGAVYGNAGAFGGDMQHNLILAEILHPKGRESWSTERIQYQYRSSVFKREGLSAVILAAQIRLQPGDAQQIQATMEAFSARRRGSQPPGASMGSMFKNPPGDYAGRLIEACGLKGLRSGDAQISDIHANFFINRGQAQASDIGKLIHTAQTSVAEKFGIHLELEVQLLGNWSAVLTHTGASQS